MNDLELFTVMLKRASIDFDESTDKLRDGGTIDTKTVVRVLHGYQAHFEAEFDDNGKLLSMGQWEDM